MKLSVFCGVLLALSMSGLVSAQSAKPSPSPSPTPAQEVPVMDGGAGPCSVELTLVGSDGKPVYAATVKVHMAYGFAGVRKLDLQAGTNWDGKVRFKGLPAKVRNPPLEFQGSKDDLTGVATYNPASECQAKHDMVLEKPKAGS